MKSRTVLPRAIKKDVHKYVEKQLHIERGYIAHCVLLASCVALNDLFGFGSERLTRFAQGVYKQMTEYYDADPDVWPDMAQRDCERIGLVIDDYWIKARDREGQEVKPKLTPEQEEYLKYSRETLLSDEESKKIHDAWKVLRN